MQEIRRRWSVSVLSEAIAFCNTSVSSEASLTVRLLSELLEVVMVLLLSLAARTSTRKSSSGHIVVAWSIRFFIGRMGCKRSCL